MLSVLIATYNWNTFSLVKELHKQLEVAKINFEIICLDDGSKSDLNKENEHINSLSNSTFESLSKNIGRSAIRNLLAKKAKFEWLLFLDADVMPTSEDFINTYIGETEKNLTSVFLGGIAYKEDVNSNRIRWKLGKKGEEQTSEIRNKNPFNYFFSANFLIKKEVLEIVNFDKKIKNYGCEDLLFAKDLENENIKIAHINNAVFHLGIDENYQFLQKTKSSLSNLSILINSKKIKSSDAKISQVYKKSMLLKIPRILFLRIKFLERKAIETSSLFYFNLFRLAYLYKLNQKK